MECTLSANVVEFIGEDKMEIKVHGGEKYVVDRIPDIRWSTPLVVVKDPDGSSIKMIMTLVAYRQATQVHGPLSRDTKCEIAGDCVDDFDPTPWVCSQPVW